MGELLKHPAWLIGAVALGALIFAGRRSGGGGDRMAAAIQSQDIATRGNVELSAIAAKRDAELAREGTARAAIAAEYQINLSDQAATSRAAMLSHIQSMQQLGVSERLGSAQIASARRVALAEQKTALKTARIEALTARRVASMENATERLQTRAAVTIAKLGAAENRRELRAGTNLAMVNLRNQMELMKDPTIMAHIERLAASQANTQLAIAQIQAETTKQLAMSPALNYAAQTGIGLGGSLLSGLLGGAGSFFGGGGSSSGGTYEGEDGLDIGTIAGLAGAALSFFSDRRLKRDLLPIGRTRAGLPLYAFRYFWDAALRVGVIAQDVLRVNPSAVRAAGNGYLMVDYARL